MKARKDSVNQVGGSGSDFANLWYSWEVSPAELSRITLEKIDCAPMFNPLRKGTVIPTGTSGIIPAGVYLAALPPLVDTCATVECYNREQKQIGLVTPAQQVAAQQAVATQRLLDQQYVRQLAQQEGLGTPDRNLAVFMGMDEGQVRQTGGDARTLKWRPGKANQDGGGCSNYIRGSRSQKQRYAQERHAASMRQEGGACPCLPYTLGPTTRLGPNQTQQGGTLANGLGYSPFLGSEMTALSCANSCVPFTNTCKTPGNSLVSGCGRQPVYYSETESREGCVGRCKMPPGRYAASDLGCRSTAFASRDLDYGTYDDLHGTNLAASAASLPQPCPPRPFNKF